MPLHACPNLRRSTGCPASAWSPGPFAGEDIALEVLGTWPTGKGSYMAADTVLKLAVIALFLFSAVLASMLWLRV
jgi:hypothetical protein